jgi:superkiller protein 3
MTLPKILLSAVAVLLAATAAAAEQSPPSGELRFSTGVMHLREGRVELALEEFKKAVKEDPKNPYFQKGLGQAYAARRSWGDAIACFRRALELNPYYVDTRNDLGYALIMSGDRDGGKKELLTAYSDPMNPAPEISAFNLGRALYEEKNLAEAMTWFRTSLTRNRSYSSPYLLLAEALVASGRLDEAIVQLEAGVREIQNDGELLLSLGQAYFKAGRFSEARMRLDDAVKADPAGPVGRAAAEQLKTIPK